MTSKLRTVAHLLLSHAVRTLSFLVPRDKRLWIFVGCRKNGMREIFADNSKYLFLHATTMKDVRAIWIARSRPLVSILREHGYEAHLIGSLKGIYYSLRAGVTVFDAFPYLENWRLAGRTKSVLLWHGKGFKKTGHENALLAHGRNRITHPQFFMPFTRTVATSPYTAELMSKTFKMPREHVWVTGLPRTDVFFRHISGQEIDSQPELHRLAELKRRQPGTYILYAPTFRRWRHDPLGPLRDRIFLDTLERENIYLYINLHPSRYHHQNIEPPDSPRVIFLTPVMDTYPSQPLFDLLITDYSSIFANFVLLDKPIIFFAHDLERYRRENGLYDDFERLVPGPLAGTIEELIAALVRGDAWVKKRRDARHLLFTHTDGEASERLVQEILHLQSCFSQKPDNNLLRT